MAKIRKRELLPKKVRPSGGWWESQNIFKKIGLVCGYFLVFVLGLFALNVVAFFALPILIASLIGVWTLFGAIKVFDNWRWGNFFRFSVERDGDSFDDEELDLALRGSKTEEKVNSPEQEQKAEEQVESSENVETVVEELQTQEEASEAQPVEFSEEVK
ncbi:hypothetical protein [Mycoplasma suis]|uniref:Uncharacterized protein n=2 Tax=Mycoplasma suis TaxID=57372 RepID=F0QR19_MYCSL|nr:hypothetical protein [Mycoplasma suis]ADX97939.1 hypothetical protein MSU_0402 [Mycoplasma suis str. Illinois]CBZ40435.1 hypothetical protein MSUIS_03420 [Mycoplasma suis KI3806]